MRVDVGYLFRHVVGQVVLCVNWKEIDSRAMVVRCEKPSRLFENRPSTLGVRCWWPQDDIDRFEVSIGSCDRVEQFDSEVVVGSGQAVTDD